jgi:hypothetical protein
MQELRHLLMPLVPCSASPVQARRTSSPVVPFEKNLIRQVLHAARWLKAICGQQYRRNAWLLVPDLGRQDDSFRDLDLTRPWASDSVMARSATYPVEPAGIAAGGMLALQGYLGNPVRIALLILGGPVVPAINLDSLVLAVALVVN